MFISVASVEEKLDEYLVNEDYYESTRQRRPFGRAKVDPDEDLLHHNLLAELDNLLEEQESGMSGTNESKPPSFEMAKGSNKADRLAWDSASLLSNSRPPSSFVVYTKDGDVEMMGDDPPIFDGNVANATPPPLGAFGGGASGGYGTLLHLACAVDSPLALSILLVLGADARASHTAFRRLMIHEAACSGSIQCLTLLLELGQECSTILSNNEKKMSAAGTRAAARHPAAMSLSFADMDDAFPQRLLFRGIRGASSQQAECIDQETDRSHAFVSVLRTIQDAIQHTRAGVITEMDASRSLISLARLPDVSRMSLARSCSFSPESSFGSFILSQGWADGHGNTPLHWAAFKNEAQCVSLLLHYCADANARAHPSGWTPLHDAAYSNSSESVKLLLDAGAHVDIRANSGATPLCFAAQENAAEAAELLLARGADLATRCAGAPPRDDLVAAGPHNGDHVQPHGRFSGYTPLHYCAHYNAYRAARVLLAHPSAAAAMEIPDLSDRLPIHVAVARGSSDVLRELLHSGARVDTALAIQRQRQQSPVRAAAPPPPERPPTPPQAAAAAPVPPVSSPVLRSMIPARPITSSKPWNCLTQRSIDECRDLISQAEQNWTPVRHSLFTPADRRAVMELLRIGKRLEMQGTGLFVDLWPLVLSFCGRGWFEVNPPTLIGGVAEPVEEYGGLPELRLDRDY